MQVRGQELQSIQCLRHLLLFDRFQLTGFYMVFNLAKCLPLSLCALSLCVVTAKANFLASKDLKNHFHLKAAVSILLKLS